MTEQETQQEGTQPAEAAEGLEHMVVVPPRTQSVFDVPEKATKMENVMAVCTSVLAVLLVIGFSVSQWGQATPEVIASVPVKPAVEIPDPPSVPNPFAVLDIEAQAAVVYDVHMSAPLFTLHAKQARPLASLTKMMTSLLAVESMTPNTSVAVTPFAIETEGDSGLFAWETWKLKDLVSFTMMSSSNDGADALAAAVGAIWQLDPSSTPEYVRVDTFVNQMNNKAHELDLSQTKYRNPSGLDQENGIIGGEGSAEDMAKLLAYIWEHAPEAIAGTTEYSKAFTSEQGFTHEADNTNEHVYEIPGLLGSKTGYTDLAGGNLAIIYDAGLDHEIVIVVLGSSIDGRFVDVKKLVDATYEYVESGWYEYEIAGSTPKG